MKRVALLGASSHIAKTLLHENGERMVWSISPFARNLDKVNGFMGEFGVTGCVPCRSLEDFDRSDEAFDLIINCVGSGTPEKLKAAGSDLFHVAEDIDNRILRKLSLNPAVQYINFSSGAVYGTAMEAAVEKGFVSQIALSPLPATEHYRIVKIYQEAKHRSLANLAIVDLRLFSFFSRFIDPASGYLMTDILRSLRSGKALQTGPNEIFRDFIAPSDLFRLLDAIAETRNLNLSLDTYSAAPVSKSELLAQLKDEFGLNVSVESEVKASPTGAKPYYYSRDKTAQVAVGFQPSLTSWEGIVVELEALGIARKRPRE